MKQKGKDLLIALAKTNVGSILCVVGTRILTVLAISPKGRTSKYLFSRVQYMERGDRWDLENEKLVEKYRSGPHIMYRVHGEDDPRES